MGRRWVPPVLDGLAWRVVGSTVGMTDAVSDPSMSDAGTGLLAEQVGAVLRDRGCTIAVAESLTGGSLTASLAAAEDASTWLRGGIVAYASEVKHTLLHVRPGPVVSEGAAIDLAAGVVQLLGSDIGLAVTGVGGPDAQDGQPPGTVWTAVHLDGSTTTRLWLLDGEPPDVVLGSIASALRLTVEVLG